MDVQVVHIGKSGLNKGCTVPSFGKKKKVGGNLKFYGAARANYIASDSRIGEL